MSQLNIHMTHIFESELQKYMSIRHIKTKAEAVRTAIKEGLEHSTSHGKTADFSAWIGLGVEVPTNKRDKFKSDEDLWK